LADGDGSRNSWPLGRITTVYPGDDQQVGLAEVKISSGTYRYPTVKKLDVGAELIHVHLQDALQYQRGGCGGTL
jgi:hypothetical protein